MKKIDNKKILTPIKFDPDFKLKLQMLAHHNNITLQGPASVAGLIRKALFKTYPALNDNLITFSKALCDKTQKHFQEKLEAF